MTWRRCQLVFAEKFTWKDGIHPKIYENVSKVSTYIFRSGKCSNAAESEATQMSAGNRAYTIRNILTEAAEFLCQNFPVWEDIVSCRHKF